MGMSTDAYLMYGYDLGSDEGWKLQGLGEDEVWEPDWLDEDDGLIDSAEKRLLASVGLTDADRQSNRYYERKKAALDQVGVEVESHCSAEYPMYVLSAKRFTAYRGDVEVIDPARLQAIVVEEDLDGKLQRACEALGIRPAQERPAWLLCSYWG